MINKNLYIKKAKIKDFYDLKICAQDFIQFIDDFKKKFMEQDFYILTAYLNNILTGILISENSLNRIDSLEKLIPNTCILLIYVNPKFRGNSIGKNLLNEFIEIQRSKGIGLIYAKIPQKFNQGIKFYKKNNFKQVKKKEGKIFLEFALWNDFGLRDSQLVRESTINNLE